MKTQHKAILYLSIALLSISTFTNAQDDEYVPKPRPVHHDTPKTNLLDKMYFGGNLGLNFGRGWSFLEASPMVGYKVTEKFSAGVSLTYMYYSFPNGYGESVSDNIYGGGIFGRYLVTETLFLHAEAKFMNGLWTNLNAYAPVSERSNIYPLLVGGGYRSRIGSNSSMFAMILYDLNYDPNRTLFPSPFLFTFGFGYGF